jgi:hypothetical protein
VGASVRRAIVDGGLRGTLAHLPNEWRNNKGKADWDSALASLLNAGKTRAEIAGLFESVLQNAQTPDELAKAKFFGVEAEHSIGNRVADLRTGTSLGWRTRTAARQTSSTASGNNTARVEH